MFGKPELHTYCTFTRLKEKVVAQGIEMQRRWMREVEMQVEEERGGRLACLDELGPISNAWRDSLQVDNSSYLDKNMALDCHVCHVGSYRWTCATTVLRRTACLAPYHCCEGRRQG